MAIDPGEKRTGLATGDAATGLVFPLSVLSVPAAVRDGEALLQALADAVAEHLGPDPARHPGELVVGIPLNMDDTEGPPARRARALAQRLAQRTGRQVHLQDERLTSAAAEWALARSGLTRGEKKSRRDALAAAEILRDFLAQRARAEGSGPTPDDT